MSKPQKRCIFCGATGMSKEHIWGDWMKKHVATTMPKHSSSVHVVNPPGEADTFRVWTRSGDPLQSKARVVCTTCNNTWLSRIQNTTKPLLIPMFTGQTCVLGVPAQTTIATWAAMATMTAEHLTKGPSLVAVSQADREWLWKKGTPPPDWRIWIGRFQRHKLPERWTHCSVPIYEREPMIAANGMPQCNTQTTTFMIGDLLVHAMSAAFPNHAQDWDWRSWPRGQQVVTQIWPTVESATVWPIQSVSLTDADAYHIARAFFGWVDAIGRAATTGLIIRP
jgi:hypothetical protein